MKLFEVGDLIIHPERYANDIHAGTRMIIKVEDKNVKMSLPDWHYHMVHQSTGEKTTKGAYGIYCGVERGFLTHVSGGATGSLSG
tara:strand:+ start:334 stop:588 length:255 start_codon:yes stop_codon:yes gene_type:complete